MTLDHASSHGRGRATTLALAGLLLAAAIGGIAWWLARNAAAEAARFPAGAYAYLDGETGQLFHVVPEVARRRAPSSARGSHPIRISRDAARAAAERGAVPVVLPDGTRYEVAFERAEFADIGDWTFVGRVPTLFGNLASVLTFGPDGVFGTLPAPDGRMFHVTTSHGVSRIAPAGGIVPPGVDSAAAAAPDIAIPQATGHDPVRQAVRARQLAVTGEPQVLDDEPQVIDVLGVYTTNLVALRGSASAAETEFTNLLAIANQAHIDSGTVVRLRLARLVSTDYPAGNFNRSALDALTGDMLPDGLGIAELRREAAADLVAMLRPYAEGDPTCGIAWLNGAGLDPGGADAEHAVSISNVDPCGPLVLAHEIGHSLGSTHDAPNVTTDGAYPYSMGYRQEGPPGFGTVMSYAGSMPWIGRFSDPLSQACKADCGTALADNVRSLNQMASRAAVFVNPPGTIVIDDAIVAEGHDTTYMTVPVRLAQPAGPGGVSFDVEVMDGTATVGGDVVATPGGSVIPEGESEGAVAVQINGDRDDEADETFRIALRNVVGAEVHGGEAIGVILDDDPAAGISGRLVFPADAPAPDSAFILQLYKASGASLSTLQLGPPSFEYSVEVMEGTGVVMELREHPAGFAEQRIDLGAVAGQVVRNIPVSPLVRVSGKVLFPEGFDPPASAIDVAIRQSGPSGGFGWYVEAAPPDFEFERAAFNRGSEITVTVYPPAPFHGVHRSLGVVDGDVHAELQVHSTPLLMSISGWFNREDDPPAASGSNVTVVLSGPAPAGGASVRLTAVPDSAEELADFSAFDVVLPIPAGATSATTSEVLWVLSDDMAEPDERFWVVPSEANGVRLLPGVRGKLVITDDDHLPTNTGDVDGDGASDLLWHSHMEQLVRWQLMRGSGVRGLGERYVGDLFRVAALDDIDSNGDVDVVWEDLRQEDIAFWNSNQDGFQTTYAGDHPAPGWRSVGSVDVLRTGYGRALWLDPSGTRLRIALEALGAVEVEVPAGARLAATGDLDGDSYEDLLWQEGTSNRFLVWNGRADGTFAPPVPLQVDVRGGMVFAAQDVDADGRDELLWRADDGAMLRWWSVDGAEPVQGGQHAMTPGSSLVALGDYNGDGRADLVWRDARRRQVWLLLAWVGGFVERPIGEHPGGDWAPILPGVPDEVSGAGGNGGDLRVVDVDGDGVDDVAWHNPSLGQLDWWRMQAGARAGLLGRRVASMELVGLGDFDGDGAADVAWRDRAGDLWLESAWNAEEAPPVRVPAGFDLAWRHVGIADVDGDGRDDMLWQHDARRQLQWWSIDGATLEAGGLIDLPADVRLVVTGDLDGDGRDDLVWHDQASGEGMVLMLRDGARETARFDWPADPSFRLEAAGDVDGDGSADLIWHDRQGGRLAWWRMDGARRLATHVQPTPEGHRIAGTGDFDGDGDAEVLWRDRDRHALAAWQWTGSAFTGHRIADEPAAALESPRAVTARPGD